MITGGIGVLPVSAPSNRFAAIITNWMMRFLLCTFWMIMFPFYPSAAPDLEQEGQLEYFGSIGGRIIDAHQLDDNILAVLLPFGLETYDNRNPQEPVFLSRLNFARESKSLAVYGTTAYIGAADGVHVVRLANPNSPQEKALLGDGVDVEIEGPLLRVFEMGKGGRNSLMVYRIDKTPESPLALGEKSHYNEDLYDMRSCTTDNAKIDIGTDDKGVSCWLSVYSSSAEPILFEVPEADFETATITRANKDQIALCNYAKLTIIDLSDPLHPEILWQIPVHFTDRWRVLSSSPEKIVIEADGPHVKFFSIDLPDLTIREMNSSDSSVYVSEKPGVALPTTTSARSLHISEIIPNAVQVKQYDGKYIAWVGSDLLQSFDVSDPLHPDLLSSVQISGSDTISYMIRRGDIIVAASSNQAAFINIADPEVPKIISRFSAPDEINAMDYWENIYLFACDSGLVAVDCSSMDVPQQVGFCKTENRCTGIAAENGMAYVAAKDILVFRVASPTQPFLIGRLAAPEFEQEASTVVKYKNTLFLPFRVDVTRPFVPVPFNDSREGGYHLLQKDRVLLGRSGLNYILRNTRHSFGGDVILVIKRNSEPATDEPDYLFEIKEGRGVDVSADGLIAVADGPGGLLLLKLNKGADFKGPVMGNSHD